MKTVKICRSDGGVSIMRVIGDQDIPTLIAQWEAVQAGITAASYAEIAEAEIPQDRELREAWGHNLSVNTEKAKIINRAKTQEQIDTLEKKEHLPRVVREDLMLRFVTAAAAQGITLAQLLDVNHAAYAPGFAKVYAFDQQIKAKRSLL